MADAQATAHAGERLALSTDGSTLSGDPSGSSASGSGGSATWIQQFSGDRVLGVGAEYQQFANAHWTAGTLSGSIGLGQGQRRLHLYAEVRRGAGGIGTRPFDYSLLAAGASGSLAPRVTLQVEERRIDIDTSHGHLPKASLSILATPNLSATASYARSAGGNLGTRLSSLRLDYNDNHRRGMAGVVWGPAAPAVVDLVGQKLVPGASLTEGYVGLGRSVGRATWLVIGDYQNVAGTRRASITLNCILTLRDYAPP
ncbi:MAG: hypothetical protein KGL25_02090 [Gammaproteobacteria bacterium]|nr:hypothetical protein [Gammaproteobacteria bacterium]